MKLSFKKLVYVILSLSLLGICSCQKEENIEKKGPIKIACVGDSVTQGVGATGWKNGDYTYAYPQQLQRLLGEDYEVGNFGRGSSYIYYKNGRDKTLWYPETKEYKACEEFDADIYVVMLGTNDARVMKNETTSEEFAEQYTKLIEHYIDKVGADNVYIMGSISLQEFDKYKSGTSGYFPREPLLTQYILPKQRQIAEDLGCDFFDTYNDLAHIFSPDPEVSSVGFASDMLHPNDLGYGKLAEYVKDCLEPYI